MAHAAECTWCDEHGDAVVHQGTLLINRSGIQLGTAAETTARKTDHTMDGVSKVGGFATRFELPELEEPTTFVLPITSTNSTNSFHPLIFIPVLLVHGFFRECASVSCISFE